MPCATLPEEKGSIEQEFGRLRQPGQGIVQAGCNRAIYARGGQEPRAYRRRHESKRPRLRMTADDPKHLLGEFRIVQWRALEARWCRCFVKVVIDQALARG